MLVGPDTSNLPKGISRHPGRLVLATARQRVPRRCESRIEKTHRNCRDPFPERVRPVGHDIGRPLERRKRCSSGSSGVPHGNFGRSPSGPARRTSSTASRRNGNDDSWTEIWWRCPARKNRSARPLRLRSVASPLLLTQQNQGLVFTLAFFKLRPGFGRRCKFPNELHNGCRIGQPMRVVFYSRLGDESDGPA